MVGYVFMFHRLETFHCATVSSGHHCLIAFNCVVSFTIFRECVQMQPEIPWVSLFCKGFSQAATSFNGNEHNFRVNGDNAYAVFVTPKMNYLWYQTMASNKKEK